MGRESLFEKRRTHMGNYVTRGHEKKIKVRFNRFLNDLPWVTRICDLVKWRYLFISPGPPLRELHDHATQRVRQTASGGARSWVGGADFHTYHVQRHFGGIPRGE